MGWVTFVSFFSFFPQEVVGPYGGVSEPRWLHTEAFDLQHSQKKNAAESSLHKSTEGLAVAGRVWTHSHGSESIHFVNTLI